MNTRLSRVFSHLQCSNVFPERSIGFGEKDPEATLNTNINATTYITTEPSAYTTFLSGVWIKADSHAAVYRYVYNARSMVLSL